MDKPPRTPQVKLTPEQGVAVDKALSAYRRRTGKNQTLTGIIKDAMKRFCESEGVSYPEPPNARGKRASRGTHAASQRKRTS